MPEDHDNNPWALAKKERSAAFMMKKRAAEAKSDPAAASASEKKKGKLSLVKSFQSALSTKMQISDIKIKDIINTAMKKLEANTELNKWMCWK